MYTPIIGSTTLHLLFARFDRDLAARVHAAGCPCGHPLDYSRYARKPRGGPPDLPEECCVRQSLCCRKDGCRKRRTPPSILFLGRRVYLGAAVVLISALAEGATARRLKTLRAMLGASAPTIARWRRWWTEVFPHHEAGQLVRARLAWGLDKTRLPRSLLLCLEGVLVGRVVWVLRLLAGEHDL